MMGERGAIVSKCTIGYSSLGYNYPIPTPTPPPPLHCINMMTHNTQHHSTHRLRVIGRSGKQLNTG